MSPHSLPLRLLPALCFLLGALGLLTPEASATVLVGFDAPDSTETPSPGISEATALSAQLAGIQILDVVGDTLFQVVDDDDPASSRLLIDATIDDFVVSAPTSPASAVQPWTVTNNGAALSEHIALVFVAPLENELLVDGSPVGFAYDPADVFLDLDNGEDWFLVRIDSATSDETWYYPAIRIGPLAEGAPLANPFDMDLTLNDPVIRQRINQEFVLGLPDWQVRAVVLVPEPSTALLFALGCGALAVGGRRRS